MGFAEIIPIAKDCAIIVASITATAVGIFGLNAWRRENRGKSEIDLATDLLRSVYRVELALALVRTPFEYDNERPDHLKGKVLTEDERREARRFQFESRLKKLDEATDALYDRYLDAQVLWGPEFAETFEPLRRCTNKLQIEISDYVELDDGGLFPSSDEDRQRRQVIFRRPGRESEFDQEIAEAIAEFQSRLSPFIPGRKWKKRQAKRKKDKAKKT